MENDIMDNGTLEYDEDGSDLASLSDGDEESPIFDDSFDENTNNLFWQWCAKAEESVTQTLNVRQHFSDYLKRQKKRAKCINRKTAEHVISEWHNEASESLSKQFVHSSEPAITISISVVGFRVVNRSGKNRVEFSVLFHDGDILYAASKCYSEFLELYQILLNCHRAHSMYGQSIAEFVNYVKLKKKWLRCYETDYLIDKSKYMGKFLQAVLLESPSPGLLFEFIQNSQSCVETRTSA